MYLLRLIGRFVVALVTTWRDTYATSMGAALSYYTAFSLAPLFLLFVALTNLFFPGDPRRLISEELSSLTGPASAAAVETLLKSGIPRQESVQAAVLAGAALLAGAMSVFVELQRALDRIWLSPPLTRRAGVWAFLRARILSLGLVGGFGFLLVVSLGLSTFLTAAGDMYGSFFQSWVPELRGLNVAVHFAAAAIVFSFVYKVLPSVRIRWHDARVGAVVTAALFLVGKVVIGLYIGHNRALVGYGLAGALVVILIWIFYSAQIILFGAVFTRVYGEVRRAERQRVRGEARAGA